MASAKDLVLELHNECRKRHRVPPMALDFEMERVAERYVRSLASKKPVHVDLSNLGVNIFEETVSGPDKYNPVNEMNVARKAMKVWYAQRRDYDWGDPMSSPVFAENFYEIVWKSTRSIGVALDRGDNNEMYLVVIYSRPGSGMTDEGHKQNVFQ